MIWPDDNPTFVNDESLLILSYRPVNGKINLFPVKKCSLVAWTESG
jgi:hypothetical protein